MAALAAPGVYPPQLSNQLPGFWNTDWAPNVWSNQGPFAQCGSPPIVDSQLKDSVSYFIDISSGVPPYPLTGPNGYYQFVLSYFNELQATGFCSNAVACYRAVQAADQSLVQLQGTVSLKHLKLPMQYGSPTICPPAFVGQCSLAIWDDSTALKRWYGIIFKETAGLTCPPSPDSPGSSSSSSDNSAGEEAAAPAPDAPQPPTISTSSSALTAAAAGEPAEPQAEATENAGYPYVSAGYVTVFLPIP